MTDAAAIAALLPSPPITARWSWPSAATGNPSLRQRHSAHATWASASRSAARLVTCRPRESIPGAHLVTIATFAATRRITGNSLARTSGACCLESLSAPRARTSPGPIRSRSNSTAAATNGPARHPRPASSAPATYRAPSERSNLNRRGATRADLRDGLEEPDPVRRPVGEEGDPDDPFIGDRAPEPAVVRLSTVVAHHEVIAGRNDDRCPHIAAIALAAGGDVGVLLAHAVADHVPVLDRDPVARAPDDPLDEGLRGLAGRRPGARLVVAFTLVGVAADGGLGVGSLGRVEHDDVADARMVDQPVGEHP